MIHHGTLEFNEDGRHLPRDNRRIRSSLGAAADAVEELEATAKLWLLVRRERVRPLTAEQMAEIGRRFPR